MEKLIPVVAMKNIYYEPKGRPDKGKLYLKGQEFKVEEDAFSDYDKPVKGVRGQVRGSMRRLDKPEVVAPVGSGKRG
jgi:hypothetical protein